MIEDSTELTLLDGTGNDPGVRIVIDPYNLVTLSFRLVSRRCPIYNDRAYLKGVSYVAFQIFKSFE